MWIDVHTHLEMIETNTEEVLAEARKQGVAKMITIGCHPKDFAKVSSIAENHPDQVAATVGVHPHDSKLYDSIVEQDIRALTKKPYIIGLGEMGLDYYYNHSDPEKQREVFDKQMALAYELDLPVQIHSRDAEDDTIAILKKWKGKVRGMMHCFSGTQKLCDGALDLGFYISLSGVITFKNSDLLREVVKSVPLDRLLVETDAPFLTPAPYRGKKNQPAYVVHTAEKLSELKGISKEDLSLQLKKNVQTLFTKWKI